MCGKRPCIERRTRVSTVPSPIPASKMRTAGGRGWIEDNSSATRCATTRFSRAGVDEEQIFLAVVEEAEVAGRVFVLGVQSLETFGEAR